MTAKQSDTTKIALISLNIANMQGDIVEIKDGIKGLPAIFASKEQLVVIAKETEARLTSLEHTVDNLTTGVGRFVVPLISFLLGGTILFLITRLITLCGGKGC